MFGKINVCMNVQIDVDEAERVVVDWLQRLLVDVVRHIGTLAADNVDIL